MDVAAFLPPRLLTHLRIVLGTRHDVHAAPGWRELLEILRRRSIDVLVLDPCAQGGIAIEGIVFVRHHYPSLKVVVYTSFQPDSLHAAVEFARHGAGQLVLHRFDDSRLKFLALLEGQPGSSLSTAVIEALEPALAPLPHALAEALQDLFRHPTHYHGAKDLALAAGMGLRRMYRLHHAVGLASPWEVVVYARLLLAYAQLREGVHLFSDIESRLGYSQGRLRALMWKMFQAPPTHVRSAFKPQEFVTRVIQQVYPGAGRPQRVRRRNRKK